MLRTGTTQNTTEQPEHATLEGQGDPPPQSNLPESPQLQSHLPSLQQLEQDGYDSDSGIDHNVAINGEGPLEVDEPDIPEVGVSSSTLTGVSDEPNAGNFVNIPEEQLKKLKVVELKSELAKRSQPVSGLVNVLLERLKAALQQCLPLLTQADQAARSVDDLTGFSPHACWKALVPNDESVVELHNVTGLRAPTILEDDATFVPQKHNFSETFDRAPFLGKEKVPRRHRNGNPVLQDGKKVWDEKPNNNGGPKIEFLEEHGLNVDSSPQEWFKAFLPIYDGKTNNPTHPNTPYWTHRWANFTNKKSVMLGAGVQGGVYPAFKAFSYLEIERFISLYILQGLNPSPQVEMKFSSQASDPVQGNDLCFRMFGRDAVRRHKQFKAFLQFKTLQKSHLTGNNDQHTRSTQ